MSTKVIKTKAANYRDEYYACREQFKHASERFMYAPDEKAMLVLNEATNDLLMSYNKWQNEADKMRVIMSAGRRS
jgi:hypothetical protein